MKALGLALIGTIVQLWLCPSFAKETHLRQTSVSLGVGNVECDGTHKDSACGDALHTHETGGTFNVHTLMLPQTAGASVTEQLSQSTLGRLAALVHVRRSAGSTLVFLGIFICIVYGLVQAFSAAPESDYERQDSPVDTGSWASAYNESRGYRREAMDLLFKTGIIPMQDLSASSVGAKHIEECVQVAVQMLREGSMEEWVGNWKGAQQTFEERYSALHKTPTVAAVAKAAVNDMMAEFEFCDGSWARAYVMSAGQIDRQEAFQLLLRLGIVSKAEFRDSLVSPPYIEERVSVAMNLLKRQSLGQWVDLCETAQGNERKEYAKASVMAQFTTQGGEPPALYLPSQSSGSPQGNNTPASIRTPRSAIASNEKPSSPTEVRTMPLSSQALTRGTTQGLMSERLTPQKGHTPSGVSTFKTDTLYTRHTDAGGGSENPSISGSSRATTPIVPPPGKPIFVMPKSPRQAEGTKLSLPSTTPASTTPAIDCSQLPRLATPEQPRSMHWPRSERSMGMSGMSVRSDQSGAMSPSQGVPVQIKFANNAVSGSSWEKSVTPPGSQKFPRNP